MEKNEENKDDIIEELKVSGKDLVQTVKDIIKAGNARKIIIRNEEGEDVLVIPLTVGVVGALLLPVLAALGVLAAFLTKCTIVVVRKS